MNAITRQLISLSFLSLFTNAASAAFIMNDDFTGATGVIPSNWTSIGISDPAGSAQDLSGSIVRITDPAIGSPTPFVIYNNTAFDPSTGFTYTAKVDSFTGDSAFFGIVNDINAALEPRISVELSNSGSNILISATLNGFDDTISLATGLSFNDDIVFTLSSNGYRVQNGAFDSGVRLFTNDFINTGITLASFGSVTNAFIGVSSNGDITTSTADFNSVSVQTVPEPSTIVMVAFSLLGFSLLGRRKKAKH